MSTTSLSCYLNLTANIVLMDNEKKNLHSVLMFLTLIFFVIIASNWMKYVGIILFDQTVNVQQVLHGIFTKLDEKIILIKNYLCIGTGCFMLGYSIDKVE